MSLCMCFCGFLFFFFNDTATTEIYTLSLHDALPIFGRRREGRQRHFPGKSTAPPNIRLFRSEEHTSELQSRSDLVCRLLLEKKKNPTKHPQQHARVPGNNLTPTPPLAYSEAPALRAD